MNDQNEPDATDQRRSVADATWLDTVEAFEADAEWLTGADAPQLMALYAIARQLDGGQFQAALISQFTLVHRGLLARRPGGNGPTSPPSSDDGDDLGLFGAFGGKPWAGDA